MVAPRQPTSPPTVPMASMRSLLAHLEESGQRPAAVLQSAEVHYNPECSSNDEGEVYVLVTSAGQNADSCGYDMQWGDL